MAKILLNSLVCLLVTISALSGLRAQQHAATEKKTEQVVFEYYFGYALKEQGNNNKTRYYTEIIKVVKDTVSSKQEDISMQWDNYFFDQIGSHSYTTGIYGPFSTFEEAHKNRQAYAEITNERVNLDELQEKEEIKRRTGEEEINERIIISFDYNESERGDPKKEEKDTGKKEE